ncbi:MAG: hypothetical protein K6F75_01215 [Butyrivibrio sp.]|nr:hypothetical protein [Butyrivibrio sp.]
MKGKFYQSVKGKILMMGALGIIAAIIIGAVGVTSINRNGKNSEVVSLVDEIGLLQAQNLANDALYQYYVDESYLNASLENLDVMEQKAQQLKKLAGPGYMSSVDSIISNVEQYKSNFNEIKSINAERGYDPSTGKYAQFISSSNDLSESFKTLVNNNEWIEIHWIDAVFGEGGTEVNVDGKTYEKMIYDYDLPVAGKRNGQIFRVGGTFTYKGDYFIKNIKFKNGSDVQDFDLGQLSIKEMSGDGLVTAEITDFGGEKALRIEAKNDASNQSWEEVQVNIDVISYDMDKYKTLEYELYVDPSVYTPGEAYKYGGAISGVYQFGSNLETLDQKVQTYSKLVVEGKDVSGNLNEIEALFTEIEENIPKYTTDPSLAEASLALLSAKKGIFDELKSIDSRTLTIKADNQNINATMSNLCSQVQSEAVDEMNAVRNSVTVVIILVLIISIVILAIILVRISLGINRSVKSFQSAIEEIAKGRISTRADESGKDEFASFASLLNGFLDTLEGTVDKVKKLSDVLSNTGMNLEESAVKTKQVAGEISETIEEISKGAGEQAKDIESSSQKIVDIRSNIQQILDSVSGLSGKSEDMSTNGQEAKENMDNLTRSSDSTNEAFVKIVDQVSKTDESVNKIQEAVTLIASVADQINLLSLNASIEAARAGDAGRGFAVVASEISNLADQTNESTKIIEGIISDLSEESNKTVETINEVTKLIENQKNDIDSTSVIFASVSTGIDYTKNSIVDVLGQAESCDSYGESVVDLMTNLSAISQENAASAETTSTSMSELNRETARLANASVELKSFADELKEDLEFFK